MSLLKSIKHKSYLIARPRHHGKLEPIKQYKPVSQDVEETVDGAGGPDIFPHSDDYHVPFFITIISIVEVSVFLYHVIDLTKNQGMTVTSSGPSPLCSALIYDPHRRYEVWRLLTYMMVHSGYVHITTNIIVQLILGLPLEIVHGPFRIGAVYLAGVLTGALVTSLTDPHSFLAGASGGVYALLFAHLPTLIMNWKDMKTFFEWILSIVLLSTGLIDFAVAIYHRYVDNDGDGSIGYAAHLGGAGAGFLIGMNVLRNFHKKKWEGYLRLVCWIIWIVGLVIGVLGNSFIGGTHFPHTDWSSIESCPYYD